MKPIKLHIAAIRQFLFRDIWHLKSKEISPLRAFAVKQTKIFLVTIRGIMENKVVLRASSLTYFSLMSVVPVVAMAFGIAKGFGMDKVLQEQLSNKLNGQQEVLNYIIHFANSMLERTKGGIVAGVGLVLLFWAVMQVLSNIEASFNDIWQVPRGRTWFRKFSDYLSIMLIAPVFVILSSSVTVFITTQIQTIVESIRFLGLFSPVIRFFINMIPYLLVWILFTFIYVVMPNTKVKLKPALIAAIVAGTLFQITQWGYVKFQIGMSNYNAIYGSFAALPLFMLWVQIAWLIVLFGAEFSYATQNFEKYEYENETSQISNNYRKTLSLLIMSYIVRKFSQNQPPPTLEEISSQLDMPSRIVREIVNNLHDAAIISRVSGADEKDYFYQPAIDISNLTVKDVVDRLDNFGVSSLSIANVSEMAQINHIMEGFSQAKQGSESNMYIKNIGL